MTGLYSPWHQYLREYVAYDPSTGGFTYRLRPESHFRTNHAGRAWNGKFAGRAAGSIHGSGYVYVSIDRTKYRANRLAWFYMTGHWPADVIDHRDGVPSNNRWENLRDIPNFGNQQNHKKQVNNTSGYTGVVFHKPSGLWWSSIKVQSKRISLGYFRDPLEAHRAYLAGKAKHHIFQPVPRDIEVAA